ncbi:MAG TPA: decarboxylating 6-phosphogluconate dehydrogenase [Anaerolineaceae bacterium]|jgi:6-phosphogluconate dehydrogenase
MKLAIVGLGRMGANIARRLVRGGHQVIAYNRTGTVTEQLALTDNVIPVYSLQDLVKSLEAPRIVWVMVPSGQTTDDMLKTISELLSPGDILIDGGNSNFHDTMRRAEIYTQQQIHFVDVGTSGGIWGLKEGYSLMIGGEEEIVNMMSPIFKTLAPSPDKGWGWVGPHGAGHFVKMVHNGVEYGMMEALAEGFEIMKAREDYNLDLHQISEIWQQGSVVRSWLLDLTEAALAEDQDLIEIKGWVDDSGEGRWAVIEAINSDVPAPVITMSLFRRFESRQSDSYAAKLLAAMRNQFGGHAVKKPGE